MIRSSTDGFNERAARQSEYDPKWTGTQNRSAPTEKGYNLLLGGDRFRVSDGSAPDANDIVSPNQQRQLGGGQLSLRMMKIRACGSQSPRRPADWLKTRQWRCSPDRYPPGRIESSDGQRWRFPTNGVTVGARWWWTSTTSAAVARSLRVGRCPPRAG